MAGILKAFWIARYTFLEVAKSKLLYAVFGLGLVIWLVSFVASEFSYGVQARVSLDFGLGLLSLSCLGIAIFLGSTLIHKEIENRTVYVVLTKPTSRSTFLLGKIAGLATILAVNTLILSVFTLISYFIQGGVWDNLILWTIFFTFLEGLTVLIVVVFFSLITNPILSSLYGVGFVAVGHAFKTIYELRYVRARPALEEFIRVIQIFFPDLSALNLRQFVLYQGLVEESQLALAMGSVGAYIVGLVLISCFLFSKKQFE